MFKLSEKERHNRPINALLNNGLVFTLVDKQGRILKSACYEYQLTIVKKCNKGSKVLRTKDLLI